MRSVKKLLSTSRFGWAIPVVATIGVLIKTYQIYAQQPKLETLAPEPAEQKLNLLAPSNEKIEFKMELPLVLEPEPEEKKFEVVEVNPIPALREIKHEETVEEKVWSRYQGSIF